MAEMRLECEFHGYPLKSTNTSSKCSACYKDDLDNKQGYKCDLCSFYVHEGCITTNILSRHKHPLKFTTWYDLYSYDSCSLCYRNCYYWYQCSQCSFNICIPCARNSLTLNQTKAHEHELNQIPRKLPFTCDACGLCTTDYPWLCFQCYFIIHRACISLPRVIHINRHDHRISHVSSLGPGKLFCGVCREPVDGERGAYSCLVCPYVVHSKCAINRYSWDGKELEGVPEEDEKEERKPFEFIDQNLIKHFSHEHNLKVSVSSIRLEEDALPDEENKHCDACTLPLYSELCYKCTQCDFILHDACANLPLKKRHEVNNVKLTLCAKSHRGKGKKGEYIKNFFICAVCDRYCTGFSYIGNEDIIDVRCASISDGFKHESHPHWLFVFLYEEKGRRCEGCGTYRWFYLRCNGEEDCGGYSLCFRCATLPTSVRHKYDEHPLSLYYGEKNVNSTYCCGICEEEI